MYFLGHLSPIHHFCIDTLFSQALMLSQSCLYNLLHVTDTVFQCAIKRHFLSYWVLQYSHTILAQSCPAQKFELHVSLYNHENENKGKKKYSSP